MSAAHLGDLGDALLAAELVQLEPLDLCLGRLPPLAHGRPKEPLRSAHTCECDAAVASMSTHPKVVCQDVHSPFVGRWHSLYEEVYRFGTITGSPL